MLTKEVDFTSTMLLSGSIIKDGSKAQEWLDFEDEAFCSSDTEEELERKGGLKSQDKRDQDLPNDSRCMVTTPEGAYSYCINSEIIEENVAKQNPQVRYIDQIRSGLVQDGFTGGWVPGEAYRRGFSFDTTGLHGQL